MCTLEPGRCNLLRRVETSSCGADSTDRYGAGRNGEPRSWAPGRRKWGRRHVDEAVAWLLPFRPCSAPGRRAKAISTYPG